jgi:hypothetical protein
MQSSLYTEIHETDLHERLRSPETTFALTCWLVARGGKMMPEEADFAPRLQDWLKPDLMILRPDGAGELVYEFYGSRIVGHAGFDMTGKKVSDFNGVTRDFYLSVYARVIDELRPIATVHRLGHFNETPLWERLIMPVARQGMLSAIYVINRARKLGEDINLARPRQRCNGLIVLQFLRSNGLISDAVIVGANKAARDMTGRRLDELLGRSMMECFPGIVGKGLWDRYIQVSATRQAQHVMLDYRQDGVAGVFDVEIAPFQDGVSIDFFATTERAVSPVLDPVSAH